ADRTIVVAKVGKKPSLDAPVILKDDLEGSLSPVLPALLRFALSPVWTSTKGKKVETTAFSPADMTKRLIPELRERFAGALERGIAHQDLPPDVAWILVKSTPLLFLVENAQPEAPQRTTEDDGRMVSASPTRGAI